MSIGGNLVKLGAERVGRALQTETTAATAAAVKSGAGATALGASAGAIVAAGTATPVAQGALMGAAAGAYSAAPVGLAWVGDALAADAAKLTGRKAASSAAGATLAHGATVTSVATPAVALATSGAPSLAMPAASWMAKGGAIVTLFFSFLSYVDKR
jgi:hypothetical protein